MIDLWYKNALIYCLDVETYQDSNGDGIGDFGGLIQRLDHIGGLGVTCIWLLPFFPSPNRDDGYDVADYYSVDPRLGTLGDFVEFSHQAHERGIRLIVDLVVNHTSDEHPWFQAARADPRSPYRDFYVWSDTKPPDADQGMVFPGIQESTWTWDDKAGAYYHHRFFAHQPDLNISNPAVREEIQKIMGFWLQLGVSGFRIDGAPFIIQDYQRDNPYRYFSEMRRFLSWRRGDAIMLAEANVPDDQLERIFGSGDRMHMAFNFLACGSLFESLAKGVATPLRDTIARLPDRPPEAQWASFVRNHDELDLSRLSDDARECVFRAFGPDPDMRLYGRGIRRRLPPMVDGDRRRMELAYAATFSLPGTPVLWYGEEVGMGENLSLPGRAAVRTPMQWSDEANGGFSIAPAESLTRPTVADGRFGYCETNVARQSRNPNSFLHWMQQAVQSRRACPEFGWGDLTLIDTGDPAVLAHRCSWQRRAVIALHNFADADRTVRLPPDAFGDDRPMEHFADTDYPAPEEGDAIPLQPYGYRWFRIGGPHR